MEVHCITANVPLPPRRISTAASISSQGDMPVESSTGFPVVAIFSSMGRVPTSPEAIFQAPTPTRPNRSTASSEKGELTNSRPFSAA